MQNLNKIVVILPKLWKFDQIIKFIHLQEQQQQQIAADEHI